MRTKRGGLVHFTVPHERLSVDYKLIIVKAHSVFFAISFFLCVIPAVTRLAAAAAALPAATPNI